jgi:methylated-DNA-[protein]-cysteine S-methyltransferase
MEDAGIYARESTYLDRFVQIGAAGEKVISCSFPHDPAADAGDDHPMLDRIDAYLEGAADSFADAQTGLTVPTDHRNVLEATREIPYGEQGSVAQVARMAGVDAEDEDDVRTVREALAANPIPLVIPDHRVRDGPSGAPPDVEQKLRSLEDL